MYAEHGITCSIGIGPTKLLAKLAAGLNKPAGVGELGEADVGGRLRDLPVGELHGVGPVTAERLAGLGLTTVGMLQDVPFSVLAAAFGRGAYGLRQLALGRSLSPVASRRPLPKSVGRELTFADDTNDLALLRATLLGLADRAVSDLRRHGLAARTVSPQGPLQHVPHRRSAPHAGAAHGGDAGRVPRPLRSARRARRGGTLGPAGRREPG